MSCFKCNIADNNPFLQCDSCERPVHANIECSGLNASELKVMALKGKRTLRFLCEDCLMGIRLVPKLIKKVDDLQEEVKKLKVLIQTGPNTTMPEDEIINELQERQKRRNNVMVFNLPEPQNRALDLIKVKEIFLELTNEDLNILRVVRLGKPNKNGHRALKVVFNDAEDANKVIRAKKDILRGKAISVNADLTQLQIKTWNKLKEEMEVRRKAGENVVVKYFNGVPKITKIIQKN